jgi:hypothetical protein
MQSYVDFPKSLDTRFGFVLVDGRARCFCLRVGYQLLDAGGSLVIHDAQRTDYHDAIDSLGGRVTFFTPYKRGQVCLIRKPDDPACL